MDRPRVTVCGLGPGGRPHITAQTLEILNQVPTRFLRTVQHPTADLAGHAHSFDHLYDKAERFSQVYEQIVEDLVAAAHIHGHIVYAVPGSPLVLEESVRRIRSDERVDVELIPAMSFLDLVWARLGVDPVDSSVRLIDGHRFASQAAADRGPLLIAHTHHRWVLSEIKLAVEQPPDTPVVVLQGLGTPDELVREVAWSDLDRDVEPDHLTSVFVPELAEPVGAELVASVELMRRLRQECPWDRRQDHGSLRRHLVEECYEVVEAIDRVLAVTDGSSDSNQKSVGSSRFDVVSAEDPVVEAYMDLEEELGDLWFQILFHSQLAAEAGQFTVADMARTIHDKLVVRHPHVFAPGQSDDAETVISQWEQAKRQEKGRGSVFDGIPKGLPALARAEKVIKKSASIGAGADSDQIQAVLAIRCPPAVNPNEGDEPEFAGTTPADIGRLLFEVVMAAHHHGVDPEAALRAELGRVIDELRTIESVTADN